MTARGVSVPELPEVETVVRDIRPSLTGKRIQTVHQPTQCQLRRPWDLQWTHALKGKTIERVHRRGKWIVVDLQDQSVLLLHLGMTGQLTVTAPDLPLTDHTHLVLDLEGARQLRFRDPRRFGCAVLLPSPQATQEFFEQAGLGPEPFNIDPSYWRERLQATRRCLKAILLDQRVIAGVGNIYADESLFLARLHPARLGQDLDKRSATRLLKAIQTVLQRAIDHRGSSIRDYVGGFGVRGSYQEAFCVYGRTGKPCRRCRTTIVRLSLAGRSTHICPRCQMAPEAIPQH